MTISDADFFARLRGVIQRGWINIPDFPGCSDGNCLIKGEALGMHTNAGCRCLINLSRAQLSMLSGRLQTIAEQEIDQSVSEAGMEISMFEHNIVTECPCCGIILHCSNALPNQIYDHADRHFEAFPECKKFADRKTVNFELLKGCLKTDTVRQA